MADPSRNAAQWTWIAGTDTESRRRAKAHTSRDAKRRKAFLAKMVDERKAGKRRPISLAPARTRQGSELARSIVKLLPPSPSSPLGAGRVDPFAQYPVHLENNELRELVDHFLYTAPSVSLKPQKRVCFLPLFQEIRRVSFELAQVDPAAFHTILAIASADRSILHDEAEPVKAIAHNLHAIKLLNRRLYDGKEAAADSTITAVALQVLFLIKLLFEDCDSIEAHVNALEGLVNLRGGLKSFEISNSQLLLLINLADYLPPAVALLGKRRFHQVDEAIIDETGISPVAHLAPNGLEALAFFDMYFDITRICQSLQRATNAAFSGDYWTSSVTETKLKSQLQDLLALGTSSTAWGRRCEIMKCICYAALIYMLVVPRQEVDIASAHEQVSQLLPNSDVPWKHSLELLVQELICGDSDQGFDSLPALMRMATMLKQQSWYNIRGQLENIYREFRELPLRRSAKEDTHGTEMTGLAALFGYFNITGS